MAGNNAPGQRGKKGKKKKKKAKKESGGLFGAKKDQGPSALPNPLSSGAG